jgi:hypothetical protein
MSENHSGVPGRVLAAGAAAAALPGLPAALRSAENAAAVPDPARGQLWRVLWDGAAQLVLVFRVTGTGTAVAAPVTVDPPASDEFSVVLDARLTVLGHAVTVWGGLATEIPFFVFDLPIGAVAQTVTEAAERAAAGGQGALPEGVSAGIPADPPFGMAAGVRADLADTLERFRDATWAPQAQAGRPLRELLMGRADVAALMRELSRALGLSLPEVIDLLKGTSSVLPEHVPVIARITGLGEQDVQSAAAPLPDGLVRELDRPRWRRELRARRAPGGSEAAARLAAAYGTLALTARQTGPASADSWPHRIRHYLATDRPDGHGA